MTRVWTRLMARATTTLDTGKHRVEVLQALGEVRLQRRDIGLQLRPQPHDARLQLLDGGAKARDVGDAHLELLDRSPQHHEIPREVRCVKLGC